jgi:hypothetical protein
MGELLIGLKARRAAFWIAGGLAAALFAAFVCQVGIPALRHDWEWPRSRELAWPWLIDSAQGWTRQGIGAPRPYPTDYIVDVGLAMAIAIFGPLGGLFAVLWAIGFIVFAAAVALVDNGLPDSETVLPICAGIVALFNPWTYNEIVAGHELMVLAYGATGFVVGGLRERGRVPLAALVLAFHQLQFFVVALLVVLRRLAAPPGWRAAVLVAFVIAPVAAGIALDQRSLLAIPTLVAWESGQAVTPLNALLLRGYYTGYAQVTEPWSSVGTVLTALLALAGFWYGRNRRASRVAFAGVVLVVAFVGSLASPIAPIVGRLYELVPALSLYRESYDVVGLVVIGYLVLWRSVRSGRIVRIAAGTAAACCIAGWFADSPAHWWVPAYEVPRATADIPQGTRVAFDPPFQPLSFGGRGSGADPDAAFYPSGGSVLNEYLPAYPGNAALALFAQTGETRNLAALSVARVVCRSWLTISPASVALIIPWPSQTSCRGAQLNAEPQLEVLNGPVPVVSIGSRLGGHAMLFGDARIGPHVIALPRERGSGDAATTWIDASLAFPARPQIAQPFGGRFTLSTEPLELPRADEALVAALRGALLDAEGRTLTTSRVLVWEPLRGARALRCRGECVVAALADGQPKFPAEASMRRGSPVVYSRALSWLVTATVPPHGVALLNWNERYDARWTLYGTRGLHVRTDGVVNGWILPPDSAPRRVVLVHLASALQALLEFCAYCAIAIAVTARLWRKRRAA